MQTFEQQLEKYSRRRDAALYWGGLLVLAGLSLLLIACSALA